MKTSLKFLSTGIASLVAVTGFAVMPAIAELSEVGPTSPETGGFPQWYKDSSPAKLQLDLCLAGSIDRPTPPNYCLTEPPDQTKPPYVDGFDPAASNFPDEAFWWTAEADASTTNVRALLVLATEAAFANEEALDGDQMVFNRTRIRIQGSRPGVGIVANTRYKITYPYGEKILTATSKDVRRVAASINITEDFGCVVTPTAECNFRDVLAASGSRGRVLNPIGKPWLTWDPAVAPAAPAGYIGDPNVDHKVIGSPTGNNFFKIERINANGTLTLITQTDLFSVSGKIHVDNPPAAQ